MKRNILVRSAAMALAIIPSAALLVCVLNLYGAPSAHDAVERHNSADGKATRGGVDLFYKIIGLTSGDYVLILSGGPGEDIHSMQGVADEPEPGADAGRLEAHRPHPEPRPARAGRRRRRLADREAQ